jgi:hypothetical protein
MSARVFSAHLPRDADPARTLLVADGWRWGPLVSPALWALWGGHWVILAALAALTAAELALTAYGLGVAALALGAFARLALALEGASFIRADRALRRWRDLGGVAAEDEEEAELRWFPESRTT